MYYRARWYDPQQGRFVSEDPIGLRGGTNFYRYVGNDPLNHKDPFGLGPLDPTFAPYPVVPPPAPLFPDNFDWWGAFWDHYWGLRNEACFANDGFTVDGKTCLPLPIMGCGLTFVTNPIKVGHQEDLMLALAFQKA
jgi:hypothetical protein